MSSDDGGHEKGRVGVALEVGATCVFRIMYETEPSKSTIYIAHMSDTYTTKDRTRCHDPRTGAQMQAGKIAHDHIKIAHDHKQRI